MAPPLSRLAAPPAAQQSHVRYTQHALMSRRAMRLRGWNLHITSIINGVVAECFQAAAAYRAQCRAQLNQLLARHGQVCNKFDSKLNNSSGVDNMSDYYSLWQSIRTPHIAVPNRSRVQVVHAPFRRN